MSENTLGAFVVKRKKILLPKLTKRYSEGDTAWCSAKEIVNKEILIESKEETPNGYYLYGTEIPVIFSYPREDVMTNPNMRTCIGVETKQWEISRLMQNSELDTKFLYKGKYITDEDIIDWLVKEENIESMKIVREWAIQYGKECQRVLEAINQRKLEKDPKWESVQKCEAKAKKQKIKIMLDRRDELISKYQ